MSVQHCLWMDNDIAGSKVWADVPPPAKVTQVPQITTKPDESEAAFPDVFMVCVVTRARTYAQLDVKCDDTLLCDLSMADLPS